MDSTIIIKNSATSGSVPPSLVQGEFGINVYDGKLYYGSGSGNVVKEFNSASYASFAVSASYAATASNSQNAQDILVYVKNVSGTQIDKGKVVRISGATGDNALIATASYTNESNSANTLGITYENIANDGFGYVITEGTLRGINTSTFTAGQLLYLGDTGSIIGTAPVAPLQAVRLGEVLRVQLNNGSMYVRIDNGYELGELHNVVDTTTTSSYGDLLVKSGSVWINSKQLTGSYGLTGSLTLIGNTFLTGSLNITGSTTQVGNNTLSGNTTLSGSIIISGAFGTNDPTVKIYGDTTHDGYLRFNPVSTNINNTISASYIYVSGSTNDLYFTQNGNGYANTTRLRWLEGNLYTGLLNGGVITTQSATVYQISSGSGIIVDLNASLSDNPYPTIQYLNWGNLSASISAFTSSYQQVFVGIDSTNNIFAQGTPFTNGQFDNIINIGNVLFQNGSTINGVKTQPSVAYGFEQQQNVFNRAFGPLKLSGYTLAPSASSTGSLIVGSGTAYAPGSNYTVDPNDPYYTVDSGTNISKIFRYYQSGSTWVYLTNAGAGYSTIDPTNYSNNGTLTGVGAGNWSIQRVFWYPNSVTKAIVVYYGNASYPTEAEALANISFESFVEAPNTAANAIYLGAVIINGNGVFTSPSTYTIYPGGLFRQVGGSGGGGSIVTTTLSGLSDVNISGPTNGQALIYNATALKWENLSYFSGSISGNAATATTASYAATASYVLNAVSASFASTASFVTTAQTASYVLNAVSSSFASTASYVLDAVSASFASTASIATSASFASTASYVLNAVSSSYSTNALSSSFASTASIATSSSFATTASYVLNAVSASYATNALSASFASTASIATSSSFATTASYATQALSSSFASTASFVNTLNQPVTISGSFTVFTGSAVEFQVTDTGTKIGNLQTDIHSVTGSLKISGSITGSLLGTASYASQALSSSFATTASYALTSAGGGSSFPFTGSAVITGSLNVIGPSLVTGSLGVAGTTRLSGSFNTAASGSILTVVGSGSTQPIFTVQGSQGELFSVTDSLSGSLFSVNDISGLPILEVFSDSTTNMGNYLAPALYTTNKITQTNSGSFVVYSLPTASYDGAFYDYTVRSGSNARAGQIMAIWSGSSVNFTETTTTDFGSTSAINFTVIVTGSNMVLTGFSSAGSWTIKTIIRSI